MKIIEGLKLAKELLIKADDLRKKVAAHSAYLSVETPVYPEQKKQLREWLQSHTDIMQEIGALRVRIAKTNLATLVPMKLGDVTVTKCITEWIARRKDLAGFDAMAWMGLTDRGLKEGEIKSSAGTGPSTSVTITRCYDPVERDNKMSLYRSEPGVIDRTLEVVNATTDLLE